MNGRRSRQDHFDLGGSRFAALAILVFCLGPRIAYSGGPPLQFAKMIGNLYGAAVASDSHGNIYVGTGPYSVPLVKLDPNGNQTWSFGPETGGGQIVIRGIVVDESDTVYVCGTVWGNVRLGAINYSRFDGSIFFGRIDSQGSNTFAKVFYNLESISQPFAQASDGGFLVAGEFRNPVTYEGITVSPTSYSDALVFRINADGSPVWYRRGTGNLDDSADGIVSNANGGITIAGNFSSTSFGMAGAVISSSAPKTSYLIKMDSSGSPAWAKSVGSSLDSNITGPSTVAYSPASDAIVWAGDFSGSLSLVSPPIASTGGKDVFVVKTTLAGTVSWARAFTGSQDQLAKATAVDSSGNIYVAGLFSGQMGIGSLALTSLGLRDLFVVKLRDDGSPVWAKRMGWTENDDDIALSFTKAGELLVTGTVRGGISIDGVFLEGTNYTDGFIAKFYSEGVPPHFSLSPESRVVSAGITFSLSAQLDVNDPSVRFQWWFNGAPLTSQTNVTLTISNAQPTNAGSYYLVAANDAGTAQTKSALISYTDASTLILSIHPSLTIFGTPGRTYRIEYASEAQSAGQWTAATNLTISSSPQLWIDSAAVRASRFYRVLLLPEQ